MRNVTIALDAEVALWVEIRAAKNGTCLPRFIADMLHYHMESDREFERAMETSLDTPVAPWPM